MSQINSHNIILGTHTVQAGITPDMVSELRNTDFYVKKDLMKPVNNNMISIRECSYKNYYEVHINYVLFDRLIKLNKIMNSSTFKKMMELVELYEQNRKSWWSIIEDDMVKELTQNINEQILDDLKKGKQWGI